MVSVVSGRHSITSLNSAQPTTPLPFMFSGVATLTSVGVAGGQQGQVDVGKEREDHLSHFVPADRPASLLQEAEKTGEDERR